MPVSQLFDFEVTDDQVDFEIAQLVLQNELDTVQYSCKTFANMTTVIQVSSVLQMTNDYTNTLALLRCHAYIKSCNNQNNQTNSF